MQEYEKPYWIARTGLPGLDFNRCLVAPATTESYPDGALAVYVDGNYWCVACLPLHPYGDMTIEEIVARLWPTYVGEATYAPDDGTIELELHFSRAQTEAASMRATQAEKELTRLRAENERLAAGRTDVTPRRATRHELQSSYFVRQYEHLLVAMAHENRPREDKPGICSVCGLYGTDRVHQQEWIDRHAAGYAPDMEWAGQYGREREETDQD